jgi:hypothetical protein
MGIFAVVLAWRRDGKCIMVNSSTMLKKLDTAPKAIASVSWAFPSHDIRCMHLVALEQGIFDLQDKIAEAN